MITTPKTPGPNALASGDLFGGAVALLRLPIPVSYLKRIVDDATQIYGAGLVMREDPHGWLRIESPNTEVSD